MEVNTAHSLFVLLRAISWIDLGVALKDAPLIRAISWIDFGVALKDDPQINTN